jgi:seryl-tRNA(Sec) selenium transferase
LWKAFMHGAPHAGIGRPMKAGKEEIMGLLAAVEAWVRRDHDAEWKNWEQRLETIWEAVRDIATMTRQVQQPGRSNVAPVLQITWDADAVGLTPDAVLKALSEGTPRIEATTHATGVQFVPYMMEEGEAALVAQRLREILIA